MDDPGPVAVVQSGEHAAGDLEGTLRKDLATLEQDLAQGPARDVLHHDVGLGDTVGIRGGFVTGVVDRHDRGVVQRGGGLGLPAKARQERGITDEVGAQPLDRDGTAQPGVGALAHLGHASTAQQFAELVAAADDDGISAAHG